MQTFLMEVIQRKFMLQDFCKNLKLYDRDDCNICFVSFKTITTPISRLDSGEDQRVDKSEFTDEKMKPIIEKVIYYENIQ